MPGAESVGWNRRTMLQLAHPALKNVHRVVSGHNSARCTVRPGKESQTAPESGALPATSARGGCHCPAERDSAADRCSLSIRRIVAAISIGPGAGAGGSAAASTSRSGRATSRCGWQLISEAAHGGAPNRQAVARRHHPLFFRARQRVQWR